MNIVQFVEGKLASLYGTPFIVSNYETRGHTRDESVKSGVETPSLHTQCRVNIHFYRDPSRLGLTRVSINREVRLFITKLRAPPKVNPFLTMLRR